MRAAPLTWATLAFAFAFAAGCNGNTLSSSGQALRCGGSSTPPALDGGPGALFTGNALPLDGGSEDYGYLVLDVRDADSGQPTPSRVIFRPSPGAGFADSLVSGRADVFSKGSATGAMVAPNVIGSNEGVLLVDGRGVVPVPPGHYELVITRGPEYELEQRSVDVCSGTTQTVTASLEHSVDTRGWLSADMHVHTAGSFDSAMLPERRLVSMVSNGVEIVVATDHNVATDLAPVAAAIGYGPDVVGTIVGDEFNFKEGHGGAYPVPYQPAAVDGRGGVPGYQNLDPKGECAPPAWGINCRSAAEAFPIMHAEMPGTTVVTVNHPFWHRGDLGYFTNIDWGRDTGWPLPTPLETAGLFDAMELLNGYQTNERAEKALLADWFFLVDHGYKVTALGNSDTHKINWVRGGWPRTWLQLPVDVPGQVDGAMLATAIRNGQAVASTGPFVTMTVDGAGLGATVEPARRGQVTVALEADAASWIDIDELQLFVDGEVARHWHVRDGQRPRFAATATVPVARDSWLVALATGHKALPPDIVGECSSGNHYQMRPWAITNPIYVDADGDGRWTAPKPRWPTGPWQPRPPKGPPPCGQAGRFDHVVGESCDVSEPVGLEPPLDSLSHLAMPLLFPR